VRTDSPLAQLLGGYFHQDWSLDDPTYADAVRRYVRETPVNEVQDALAEIDMFLSRELNEDTLDVLLNELGCCFRPAAVGMSRAQWLRAVRNLLATSLTDRNC
jgi:hypothetical protein